MGGKIQHACGRRGIVTKRLLVRTLEDEAPAQALERLFGKEFREIEVKPE